MTLPPKPVARPCGLIMGNISAASELVVDAGVAFAAQSGHVYFIGGKALLFISSLTAASA